ncbi:sulfatase [Haloarcula sp. KBTZ06]|uniref:sulfatase n=1 Tax=Haloarcula sp. KBTZ06 TaxID=3402682 RepID=UPI003B428EC4
MGPKPNIIFLVVDTCRASTFHGLLEQGKIPNFESLLDGAVLYENATAAGPWTVPSHGSMFTGLYPSQHGTSADNPKFNPPNTPIAQILREEGYHTVGISANPWISPGFNFDKGFDRFKTAYDLFWGGADLGDIRNLSSRREQFRALTDRVTMMSGAKTIGNIAYEKFWAKRFDSGAKKITSDALSILKNTADGPQFLFLNYMEPHLDYEPPDDLARDELPGDVELEEARQLNQNPWKYIAGQESMSPQHFEILRSLYRTELRYLDTQIGRLLEELKQRNVMDNTCIVIAGDHGENIGDHGLMDHQYCLYQTLVHVPLAIRYPDTIAPRNVTDPVETKEIYGALCEIANAGSEDVENPLLKEEDRGNQVISEYPEPQPSMDALEERAGKLDDETREYDRSLRAIRIGPWKLIEGSDGLTELYNLEEDPTETTPVCDTEQAERLHNLLVDELGELTDGMNKESNVDETTQGRLEDLGYI